MNRPGKTEMAGATAAKTCRNISLADETASEALAEDIALLARPGDLIALRGDLGAGKTHIARALIRAVCNAPVLEVPSPTFTLRQDYESARFPIAHFDFYRLGGEEEVDELDLDGAVATGLAIIEWPERAEGAVARFENRLEIALDFDSGDGRVALLTGVGSWAERLERRDAIFKFLQDSGHGDDRRAFLQGDASPRRYERLIRDGDTFVFMDSPAAHDPGVPGQPRYSQLACLAEDVRPFIAIADGLKKAGLRAPAILHADEDAGFLILDDLGSGTIITAERKPIAERYEAAMDALIHMHLQTMPEKTGRHKLPVYGMETMLAETALACQWFAPWRYGHTIETKVAQELQDAFRAALLPVIGEGADLTWTLRDYHSPNIIWIDEADGLARVGIIDFQDAVIGAAAYDVASLAMDARIDIDAALENALLERYVAGRRTAAGFEEDRFLRDYAVMAAQRNTKIIGIFARLALRDGKSHYLAHQPRIARYLERALRHPHLSAVRRWFENHLPEALDETRVLK